MTLTSASSDKHRQRARKRGEGERENTERQRLHKRRRCVNRAKNGEAKRCEGATEGINRMIPMGGWIEGRKDTDQTA